MRLALGECVLGDCMSDEVDVGDVKTKSPAQPEHLILAQALQAVRDGDFSARLPVEWDGVLGKVSDIFNQIVTANQQMAAQLERVGAVVGKQGRTRQRINLALTTGAWADMAGPDPIIKAIPQPADSSSVFNRLSIVHPFSGDGD